MLKYKFLHGIQSSKLVELPLGRVVRNNGDSDEDIVGVANDSEEVVLLCETSRINDVRENMPIYPVNTTRIFGENGNVSTYTTTMEARVDGVNKEDNLFTIVVPKYNYFNILKIEKLTICHLFHRINGVWEEEDVYKREYYGNPKAKKVTGKEFFVADGYDNASTIKYTYENSHWNKEYIESGSITFGNDVTELVSEDEYYMFTTADCVFLKSKYVGEKGEEQKMVYPDVQLRMVDGDNAAPITLKGVYRVNNIMFRVGTKEIDGYELEEQRKVNTFFNVLFEPEFEVDEEEDDEYHDQNSNGIISSVSGRIENPFFDNADEFKIFYDKTLISFPVPLSQQFGVDLHHADAVKTNFVDVETKKAINRIIDMEKDVYTPVIFKNGDYLQVYDIIFNLHFRKHRGKDWIVEPTASWNGTRVNGSNIEVEEAYFSYPKKEEQSDLASYLSFTNDDIKYQKSKVKKSFLRLSFYDSDNPANNHLLHSSTIFMESGNLFAKYAKHLDTGKYYVSGSSQNDLDSTGNDKAIDPTTKVDGLRVNREPTSDTIAAIPKEELLEKTKNDAIEERRMSTQFRVSDKYSSNKSSEGFYFYAYKSDDPGVDGATVYIKVEFNHAGFGRTIPFMLPYDTDGKVKSFKDVVDDNGYNIKTYYKYSFIKAKYLYDKENQRHIYYIDPDTYNMSFENNQIVLNLYEAKLTTKEETTT